MASEMSLEGLLIDFYNDSKELVVLYSYSLLYFIPCRKLQLYMGLKLIYSGSK